jgi:hypothetical protein
MIVLTLLSAASLPDILLGAVLGVPLGMGVELVVQRIARHSFRGR